MSLLFPDLKVGSTGPLVGNWQRFLNDQGVKDDQGKKLVADEAFGPRSEQATRNWQKLQNFLPTGVVQNVERVVAAPQGFIPFLKARNYTQVHPQKRVITCIIVHDMEYPERPDGAEWCAQFFAGTAAPKASAHFCVDSDSVVQCVREMDVAWHAPGANHNGIGIEHAGYAAQSRADWLDDFSRCELAISAKLVARLCAQYVIPIEKLSAEDLKAGKRGICGHADVTKAFSKSGHSDPGPNFPWTEYLEMVARADPLTTP